MLLKPETAKTLIAYTMALLFSIVVLGDIFRVGYNPRWEILAAILLGMFVLLGIDVSTNYFQTDSDRSSSRQKENE